MKQYIWYHIQLDFQKTLTDGIRLAGNLEMDGTIKASVLFIRWFSNGRSS